ncbi:hypothetical protein GCM10010349_78110 [Streptomyces flavofungini]|nr:hypothetical protein GCM10010349_78110 [Streptomyces flavofungini]
MAHVRGHHRKDGTYVRPHYRRSRRSTRSTSPSRPRATIPAGSTTHVRGYRRGDGTYVRPHRRRMGAPAAMAVGGSGVLLFVLIVLLLTSGG